MKERITQTGRPKGVFLEQPNHRVWVKSWAELIRDCESRLEFVQEKLQIQVSAEEIESQIAQLKAAILKIDPELPAAKPYSGDSSQRPDGASPLH